MSPVESFVVYSFIYFIAMILIGGLIYAFFFTPGGLIFSVPFLIVPYFFEEGFREWVHGFFYIVLNPDAPIPSELPAKPAPPEPNPFPTDAFDFLPDFLLTIVGIFVAFVLLLKILNRLLKPFWIQLELESLKTKYKK